MSGVAAGGRSVEGRVKVGRRSDVKPDVLDALSIAIDSSEDLVDDVVRRARPGSIGRPERFEGQAEFFERHASSLAREPAPSPQKTRGATANAAPREGLPMLSGYFVAMMAPRVVVNIVFPRVPTV